MQYLFIPKDHIYNKIIVEGALRKTNKQTNKQMSMTNFMNYFLSTAAEGFVPSHAPFKNNKHLNILFSQLSQAEERTSQSHKA